MRRLREAVDDGASDCECIESVIPVGGVTGVASAASDRESCKSCGDFDSARRLLLLPSLLMLL